MDTQTAQGTQEEVWPGTIGVLEREAELKKIAIAYLEKAIRAINNGATVKDVEMNREKITWAKDDAGEHYNGIHNLMLSWEVSEEKGIW
jgi:hypothetical protein